jgi:hypothetical protein
VEEDEWMRERANESEEERSPTPPRFRSPTPSQKRTPAPRPVTPTRGRKRMAIGTPAPARRYGPPRLGEFAQSALEVIEARLNSKLASLLIDAEAREKRLNERLDGLAIGWETAVAGLSEKLAQSREAMETAENRAQERALAVGEQLEEMKKKIAARNDWEEQQWGELGTQLQWEEKELREIKQGVDSLVRENRKERKRK